MGGPVIGGRCSGDRTGASRITSPAAMTILSRAAWGPGPILDACSWGVVGEYDSECCRDGVREGVGGASVAGFEGFRVLRWAMTRSIRRLIVSMARCRPRAGETPGDGVAMPGPTCPVSAMCRAGGCLVGSSFEGPSLLARRPGPVRARASWTRPDAGSGTWARRPVGVQAARRVTPVAWCLPE